MSKELNLAVLEQRLVMTSFAALPALPTGANPMSVITADFNNDGKRDLIVGASDTNGKGIWTHLGNGDGTFGAGVRLPTTGLADGLVAWDFDGDKEVEIAVALRDPILSTGSVAVYHVNSAGTFNLTGTYPVGLGTQNLTGADVNHDGRQDLIATNTAGGSVSVLLSRPNGTFEAAITQNVGLFPQSVVVGDFNEDGNADMAVASLLTLSICNGNGDGTFGSPTVVRSILSSLNLQVVQPSIGDFNQDGHLDMSVPGLVTSVGVLLGKGDGTFTNGNTPPVVSNARSIATAIGDIDNDGKQDIVTIDPVGGRLIAYGTANGDMNEATAYNVGNNPSDVTLADVNNDGKMDALVTNAAANTISVMMNTTPGTVVGILDAVTRKLFINGTADNDTISVDQVGTSLRVTRNGVSSVFEDADVSFVEINGQDGDDTLDLSNATRAIYASGGYGNDTIVGSEFNDSFFGSMGDDSIHGGEGDDRIYGGKNKDRLFGDDGSDRLSGQEHADYLDGGGGTDTIHGDDGSDVIVGGSSNDRLYGDTGNDLLLGGKGNDFFDGGDGTDRADYDVSEIIQSIEMHV